MKDATEYQHHIRLVTKKPVKKIWITMFLKTVEKVGPDTILNPIQELDNYGRMKEVSLHTFKDNENYICEVPLKRNLEENEAEKIVIVWNELYENGDFIIETSTEDREGHIETDDYIENETNYERMSEKIAQEKHTRWLQDKSTNGWRYGQKYNLEERTHPMMLPWEQLSNEYKEVDNDLSFLQQMF